MAKKKFDLAPVVSAAAAGAGYNFAIEAVAKRVTFVNDNFLMIKALGGGLIGSAMVYLGKDEKTKAAGYGVLGVAGASGAAKLSTVLVTDEPMNGLNATARRITKKIIDRGHRTPRMVPGARPSVVPGRPQQRPGAVVPTASLNPFANIYGGLAYADTIYG